MNRATARRHVNRAVQRAPAARAPASAAARRLLLPALAAAMLAFGVTAARDVMAGSGILQQAEAVADLRSLHDLLRLNYAGYDDLERELCAAGDSWAGRTERFLARLHAQPAWHPQVFYGVVREYLQPVQDAHFWTQGPPQVLGLLKPAPDRYITHYVPYFAEAKLRHEGGRIAVAEASHHLEHALGLELVSEVPLVAHAGVALATSYLFPTPGDSPADQHYLLGQFHHEPPDAPLAVDLRRADGQVVTVELRLHRSRACVATMFVSPWSLHRPPSVTFPTLCVRTMDRARLSGLQGTARPLSREPVLILDLRGNGGGSDEPAMNWFARFSRQTYRLGAWADLSRGVAEGPGRWRCGTGAEFDHTRAGEEAAEQRYDGRLFVLMDRATASSGETFAAFAGQVDRALFLGENSQGCVTYGNCDICEELPHSRITVRFGRSKLALSLLRPTREGVGFFPDYWLDGMPPDEAVRRLLSDPQRAP